jgi:hypothetical protein
MSGRITAERDTEIANVARLEPWASTITFTGPPIRALAAREKFRSTSATRQSRIMLTTTSHSGRPLCCPFAQHVRQAIPTLAIDLLSITKSVCCLRARPPDAEPSTRRCVRRAALFSKPKATAHCALTH